MSSEDLFFSQYLYIFFFAFSFLSLFFFEQKKIYCIEISLWTQFSIRTLILELSELQKIFFSLRFVEFHLSIPDITLAMFYKEVKWKIQKFLQPARKWAKRKKKEEKKRSHQGEKKDLACYLHYVDFPTFSLSYCFFPTK